MDSENVRIRQLLSKDNKAHRLTIPAFTTFDSSVVSNDKFSPDRRKLRSQSTTDLPNLVNSNKSSESTSPSDFQVQLSPETKLTRSDQELITPTRRAQNLMPGQIQTFESVRTISSSTSTESSDSENEKESIGKSIPICEVKFHEGKVLVDTQIECSVEQLFTLLFTGSNFFKEFHDIRGTTNMMQTAWVGENSGQQTRIVNCTVKLTNKIGPPTSRLTEKQVLLPHSRKKVLYAIDMETNNAGIPYADSFYVAGHFCLSRLTERTSRLLIFGQVKYKKSVMMLKGFIEKQTYAGLSEFYTALADAVKEEARKNQDFLQSSARAPSDEQTSSGQRSTSDPNGQRTIKKFKRPAPPPPIIVKPSANASSSKLAEKLGIAYVFSLSKDSTFILRFIFVLLIGLSLLHVYMFVKIVELETLANNRSNEYYCGHRSKSLPSEEWFNLVLKQSREHKAHLKSWYEALEPTAKYLKGLEIIKT